MCEVRCALMEDGGWSMKFLFINYFFSVVWTRFTEPFMFCHRRLWYFVIWIVCKVRRYVHSVIFQTDTFNSFYIFFFCIVDFTYRVLHASLRNDINWKPFANRIFILLFPFIFFRRRLQSKSETHLRFTWNESIDWK